MKPKITADASDQVHVAELINLVRFSPVLGVDGITVASIPERWRKRASWFSPNPAPGSRLTVLPDLSNAELRRAMRALPATRRRGVARAVRDGRAVDDPRDAHIAVKWAQRAQAAWWPGWFLPQNRPRGWRAVLWLFHVGWVLVAVMAVLVIPMWHGGGFMRWLVVAAFAYSIVTLPWVFAFTLRTRWNAPESERRNRELLRQTADG